VFSLKSLTSSQLNEFLIERLGKNEKTLLIVDEAQTLSIEMLEEIRLLSNLETPRSKLIQIILVGQPELKEMLRRPELRQLRQRIALSHHLRPFDEEESRDYVEDRLRRAGHTGGRIFKRGALRALYQISGGTPRLLNVLCDSALLTGFTRDQKTVDAKMIREAARDLDIIEESPLKAGLDRLEASGETRGSVRGLFRLFRL